MPAHELKQDQIIDNLIKCVQKMQEYDAAKIPLTRDQLEKLRDGICFGLSAIVMAAASISNHLDTTKTGNKEEADTIENIFKQFQRIANLTDEQIQNMKKGDSLYKEINIFFTQIIQGQENQSYTSDDLLSRRQDIVGTLNGLTPPNSEMQINTQYVYIVNSMDTLVEWAKEAHPGDSLYVSSSNHVMSIYARSDTDGKTIIGFYDPNTALLEIEQSKISDVQEITKHFAPLSYIDNNTHNALKCVEFTTGPKEHPKTLSSIKTYNIRDMDIERQKKYTMSCVNLLQNDEDSIEHLTLEQIIRFNNQSVTDMAALGVSVKDLKHFPLEVLGRLTSNDMLDLYKSTDIRPKDFEGFSEDELILATTASMLNLYKSIDIRPKDFRVFSKNKIDFLRRDDVLTTYYLTDIRPKDFEGFSETEIVSLTSDNALAIYSSVNITPKDYIGLEELAIFVLTTEEAVKIFQNTKLKPQDFAGYPAAQIGLLTNQNAQFLYKRCNITPQSFQGYTTEQIEAMLNGDESYARKLLQSFARLDETRRDSLSLKQIEFLMSDNARQVYTLTPFTENDFIRYSAEQMAALTSPKALGVYMSTNITPKSFEGLSIEEMNNKIDMEAQKYDQIDVLLEPLKTLRYDIKRELAEPDYLNGLRKYVKPSSEEQAKIITTYMFLALYAPAKYGTNQEALIDNIAKIISDDPNAERETAEVIFNNARYYWLKEGNLKNRYDEALGIVTNIIETRNVAKDIASEARAHTTETTSLPPSRPTPLKIDGSTKTTSLS